MSIIKKFSSPFGEVELTDERKRHIFHFHPEVKKYRGYLVKVLAKPETIRASKYDPAVRIIYHKINVRKYLAVVIKINQRNFVLTAYLTTKF